MNYILVLQTMVSAIKAVEALMPDSPGKDNFDAALVMVTAIVGDVTPLIPALKMVATLVVNGLRSVGIFGKKAAA